MKAYESGAAQYFATPPVNLIYAFNASLKAITKSAPSLEERFKLHKEASQKVKKALEDMGLRQVGDPAGLLPVADGQSRYITNCRFHRIPPLQVSELARDCSHDDANLVYCS